jgi:NADPH-dependent curcumin reductase CurA
MLMTHKSLSFSAVFPAVLQSVLLLINLIVFATPAAQLLEICKPKPDEVVAVSGAAGAVGSHVGQLQK